MPFALNHGNRRALNEASASLTVPEPGHLRWLSRAGRSDLSSADSAIWSVF
jgi:hypothetical protein